jgi:hypothetical protein
MVIEVVKDLLCLDIELYEWFRRMPKVRVSRSWLIELETNVIKRFQIFASHDHEGIADKKPFLGGSTIGFKATSPDV